jgi:hypothetical protein
MMATMAIGQADTILPLRILSGIEETVSKIKDNEASYKKTEKYRDSLGARYAFTKEGELVFTRAEVNEPIVNKKVEWYFDHEQIIFCEQIWTIIRTGKAFNENKEVDPGSNAFKETEFYLLEYSKTLLKEAKEN